MTTHRQIRLLGSFQVTVDGEAVTQFGSDTARALLAYLALHPGTPLRRDTLAGLLWPEQSDAEARRNLRVALSRLRAATQDRDAPAPLLHVERQTILFAEDARHLVDVGAMRAALGAIQAHAHEQLEACAECAELLQEATALYCGEFLAGFSLDSVPFEEWMVVERESLHWQALEALSALADYYERQGNYEAAIESARRQVELEAWRESAHRQCMRALAASGHRGAALAQYEACRRVLAEELGVEPEPETQALCDRIRSGAFAPALPQPQAHEPIKPFVSAPVSQPSPAPLPPGSVPARQEDERRVVTAMSVEFARLPTSDQSLDPELWAELVGQALRQAARVVDRYGGEISQLRENGLVALFGAAAAHEDDPERAILAALELAQAIQEEGELQAQGGIYTGEAVVPRVSGGGPREVSPAVLRVTALGNVVPVADQIERVAGPGTVLASEATYRLARPLFEWETCVEVAVGHYAGHTYRPLRRALQADALRGKGRGIPGLESPLVGRYAEVDALEQALDSLQQGIGGIVTVVGDAGIGKSRLVAEIRSAAADQQSTHSRSADLGSDPKSPNLNSANLTWLEGRCLSYTSTEAYHLWMGVLRALLDVAADATATAVRDMLRERVDALCGEEAGQVYPFLARMISLPLGQADEARLHGLGAMSLRHLTFRAWETLLECAASQTALTLVCEDLHWADPTSLALLERLLPLAERVPLLLICVFRPITDHGCWQVRELAAREFRHRHTDLFLEALNEQQSGELVGHLLRIEDLPARLRARILEHAEGNPFYVEEILRSLIDGGTLVYDEQTGRWQAAGEPADLPLPDTLRGVLTARIDRLPLVARHVLQLASVVGRIFERRVLESLIQSTGELDEVLRALQRAQMVRLQAQSRPPGQLPEATYIFKHQLTLEAAYASLLRRKRRDLHRRVAEALERLYPEQVEERLGLLGYHWERAGDVERAVRYLRRAGDQAAAHFANGEAVAFYTRALDLTPAEDVKGRYALLLAREAVHNVQGERVAQAQDLAALEALADGSFPLGDAQQAVVAVRRAHHAIMTADNDTAIAAAQLATRLGQASGDVQSQATGHRHWGRALRRQSENAEAQVQLERALALARGAGLRREEAYDLRQLGNICFDRDDYAQASAYHEQALPLLRQTGDRRGEGMLLRDLAWALRPQGKTDLAQRYAELSLQVCRETGDRRDEAWALLCLGHIAVDRGDPVAAVDLYERCLPLMHETDPIGEIHTLTYCGMYYAQLGDYARAASYLEPQLHFGDAVSLHREAGLLASLAFLAAYRGDREGCWRYIRSARQILQDLQDRQPHPLLFLGHALFHLGHLEEAADAYRQAERASPYALGMDWTTELLAGRARISLAQGEPEAALVDVEEILSRIHSRPPLPFTLQPLQIYLSCYHVLRANEDLRADSVLDAAHRLLQEQAQTFRDPERRRMFLENVPAHREIAALYAQTDERPRTMDDR